MFKNAMWLDKWSLKLTQMLMTTPAIWLTAHGEKACIPAFDRSRTSELLLTSLGRCGQIFCWFLWQCSYFHMNGRVSLARHVLNHVYKHKHLCYCLQGGRELGFYAKTDKAASHLHIGTVVIQLKGLHTHTHTQLKLMLKMPDYCCPQLSNCVC